VKRLLISLVLFTLILLAIDRIVGHALATRYRVAPSDEADAIGRGIAARAPLVICGSSRARHHYDPDTLAARLGMTAWNFGRDGQFGPFYSYGVAELVLRSYMPRLWILEVDDRTISGPDPLSSLNVLLPYAAQDPAIAELVNHRSRYERLKRLSAIYPYNSLVLALYDPRGGGAHETRRGYAPIDGAIAPADTLEEATDAAAPLRGADSGDLAPNPLKRRYLQAMIDSLERRGVTVLAVRSPEFLRGPRDRARARAEAERLRSAFAGLKVRFLDLGAAADPELAQARYFRDRTHLNRAGADRFSSLVADSILSLGLEGRTTPGATSSSAGAGR
jgi:hypothetical protein